MYINSIIIDFLYVVTKHSEKLLCSVYMYNYVIAFCLPPLQIFLVADVMYSFLVQYNLKHGLPRLDQLGKPVKLKLY